MDFNLYLDFAAVAILVFLAVSVLLKGQIRSLSNKIYLACVGSTLITALLDILASQPSFSIELLFALNTLFMFMRAFTIFCIFGYAITLVKTYYVFIKYKLLVAALLLPLAFLLGMLIANIWTKSIFDYLPGPKYVRGDLIWTVYIVAFIYGGASLIVVLLSRRFHSYKQLVPVFAAFTLQLGSSIFQFFTNAVLIEMFMNAVTLLTLSLFVENPEHFLDLRTQCLNFSSFTDHLDLNFHLGKRFSVFLVHVGNSSAVYNLYDRDRALSLVRASARALETSVRRVDRQAIVYYSGSETFAIVFSDEAKGEQFAASFHASQESYVSNTPGAFRFQTQTCLVECPEDAKDSKSLFSFARSFSEISSAPNLDLRPYRSEKGNVALELDKILERAIREKSFSMYYQPIYSVKRGKFVAAEALIRLIDPDFGLIMPDLMIPYAEQTGKIKEIGDIVLEKTFAFFASSLKDRVDFLDVNLAPLQLTDPNLLNKIKKFALKYNVSPNAITFEVTESDASLSEAEYFGVVEALAKEGFHIAIDDFGAGYSNFTRIIGSSVGIVKIDKSVTDLLDQKANASLFKALIDSFHDRGIRIVVEGVETDETVDIVREINGDYIQGFYYSKPLPEKDAIAFLDTHSAK